jgi:DivIVA domain-containing protein
MAITAADIQNVSFSIDRKGYDVDEVDVFLERVADEIQAMTDQIAELKAKAGAKYFKKDHTHASKLGAQMNAKSFAKGLKANGSTLAKYLKK